MPRFICALSVLFCLTLISQAQTNLDILTISGRFGVPTNYVDTYPGKAKENGAMVNLKAPIVFNESTIWYNNLTYFNFNVDNSEAIPSESISPINLHGFILQTGLYKKLANDRGFQLLFAPRYMSDLQGNSGEAWQFGAVALFERKYSDQLLLRYGALYNQELFGPNLVPLIDIYWQFAERWSVSGLFPIHAKVTFQATQGLQVGFSHFGLTTTYILNQAAYSGQYIERTSIDLALFARQKLFGNIYLEGRFGHTLNRKYAQYNSDQKLGLRLLIFDFNDNRNQINENFANGFIGNIRLVYNIPI